MAITTEMVATIYSLLSDMHSREECLFDKTIHSERSEYGFLLEGVFYPVVSIFDAIEGLEDSIGDTSELHNLMNVAGIHPRHVNNLQHLLSEVLKPCIKHSSKTVRSYHLVSFLCARHLNKYLSETFDNLLKNEFKLTFSDRVELLPLPLLCMLSANGFMVSEMTFPKEQHILSTLDLGHIHEKFQPFLFLQQMHAESLMNSCEYPDLADDYYWSYYCKPTVSSVNAYAPPAQVRRAAKAFYQLHDSEFSTALDTCIKYLMKLDGLKLRNAINTLYAIHYQMRFNAHIPSVILDHLSSLVGPNSQSMLDALSGLVQKVDFKETSDNQLNVIDEITGLLVKAPEHVQHNTLRYLQGLLAQTAA